MLFTRRHRRVLLARPHRASCFRPKPPTLDTLTDDEHHRPPPAEQEYGYPSYHHHVVLGVDEVGRGVHTVTDVFGTRGLTTPFLFSSLALDVNTSGVRRFIRAFLRTCVSFPAPDTERTWYEKARFAVPAELAMCLRWGLARVLRVYGATLCEAFFLGPCTSSGVGPKLVSPFLRHVFIHVTLISVHVHSPRSFSNPF